jgi:hypothetical protein
MICRNSLIAVRRTRLADFGVLNEASFGTSLYLKKPPGKERQHDGDCGDCDDGGGGGDGGLSSTK